MADKIKVPQRTGEVTITRAGESRTWRVQDGLLSPANQEEHDLLLARVPGAKPAPEQPQQKEK